MWGRGGLLSFMGRRLGSLKGRLEEKTVSWGGDREEEEDRYWGDTFSCQVAVGLLWRPLSSLLVPSLVGRVLLSWSSSGRDLGAVRPQGSLGDGTMGR